MAGYLRKIMPGNGLIRQHDLAAVALAFASVSAEPPPANDPAGVAIDNAVRGLERALAGAKDNRDKIRLEQAIHTIRDARRAEINSVVPALEDAPLKFKGRTVVLQGCLAKATEQPAGRTSFRGEEDEPPGQGRKFAAVDKETGKLVEIWVTFPAHIKRPAVGELDELVVTVEVRQGDLKKGNVVKAIRVP